MAGSTSIQQFVHSLEEGRFARVIQVAVPVAIVLSISVYLIISRFNGLSTATGMDQAQIARELVRGNGFSTRFIRPIQIEPLKKQFSGFPTGPIPDTYHGPLHPAFNAGLIFFARNTWQMPDTQMVYPSDRLIAIGAILCFLVGALINFFTLRRLFDAKLAALATGLVCVSLTFWQTALSGLPQMLMFVLFSAASYSLVRAIQVQVEQRNPMGWLALTSLFFGLLALTHALTIWIFLGLLVFSFSVFLPRFRNAAVMVGVFLLCYSPWLVRNYAVSGNPVGPSIYTLFYQSNGELDSALRTPGLKFTDLSMGGLRRKMQAQAIGQLDSIYGNLGHIVVAPFFFVALLHLFKRPDTALIRWAVLSMWVLALVGMSAFGLDAGDPGVNDLNLLFIPLMTAYGLAFLLVFWNRTGIRIAIARTMLIVLVFAISAAPFVIFLMGKSFPVQWPPYVAPFIAKLGAWTAPNEIIASDMPWAVAWYADRKSLWIPKTPERMVQLNDWNELNAPIVGLYLTPITGDERFVSDIAKGEWKDWAPLVMHTTGFPAGFPFRSVLPMPLGNECIFYADSERWIPRGEGN